MKPNENDIAKAREVADFLFHNGAGQEATRLLLIQEECSPIALHGARYLGGYCKEAVADVIAQALANERAATWDAAIATVRATESDYIETAAEFARQSGSDDATDVFTGNASVTIEIIEKLELAKAASIEGEKQRRKQQQLTCSGA